jgi:hypothetical protein
MAVTIFFLPMLIQTPCRLFGCDNTLLEMLTGSKAQDSVNEKLLVISSKMQVTAELAKAFNHAAAEKMHQESMESWLYVATQITSDPPGSATGDIEFNPLLVKISRDLGTVRQLLAGRQSDDVHDRLELCVSRMSLLAAIINGNTSMREFLSFELLLLGLRPLPLSFAASRAAIALADFNAALDNLKLPQTPEVKEKTVLLKTIFANLQDSAAADGNAFSKKTLTSYLTLYNEFSALKKILLADKYFVAQ